MPSWKRQTWSPFRALSAQVPRGPTFTRRSPPTPQRPHVEKYTSPASTVGAPVIEAGALKRHRMSPVRASSATKLPSQVPTKTVFRQTAAAVYTYVPTCRAHRRCPLPAPKA